MVDAHQNPSSIHRTRLKRISSFGPLSVQAWLGVETEDGCSIIKMAVENASNEEIEHG